MKETEELKTHKCSKCGQQVVLECFDYDDCDYYCAAQRDNMKISNFEFEKMEGSTALDKVFWASVVVETGFLFLKKKERRRIRKEYACSWHFVDTGEFAPAYQVEALARAHEAQTGQET